MAIIHEQIKAKIEQHRLWIQSNGQEGAIAHLRNASLHNADLQDADLYYANLSFANLSCADLSNANLSSTNLNYADLSSTDLSCADLSSTDLRYAIGNMREVKSMHFELVSVVWYYDAEGEIIVCMGSQCKRLQEWKTSDRDDNVVQDGDPNRWKSLAPILWQLLEAFPPVPWKKSEVQV